MSYKEKLYHNYVGSHLSPRKGDNYFCLDKITRTSFDQRFKKHLIDYKEKIVIDLGSGSGHLLRWLSELNFINLKGVEINKDLTNHYPENVKYENIDIINYLLRQNNFDLVILKDVLEHFNKEDAFNILEKIYTSLNKNGRVIIQVPNAESPLFGRVLYGDYTHEQSFTATALTQVLSAIGYKDIIVKSYNPAVYNFTSLIRFLYFKLVSIFYYLLIMSETNIKNRFVTMNIIVIANKK